MLRQLENLRTYPGVEQGERTGRIRLTGWWFDIGRAEVFDYDRTAGRFVLLDEERIARMLAEHAARQPAPPPRPH